MSKIAVEPLSPIVNGIPLDALAETVDTIRESPSIGRFRFQAKSRWNGGGFSSTRIHGFYGAGQERSHGMPFVLDSDLPTVAVGTDQGGTPHEYLLTALAACLVAGLAYQGARRGIRLQHVEASLEAEVDLGAFLGVAGDVRPGFEEIVVKLSIESGASEAEIDELIRAVEKGSTIVDMLTRPVPIRIEAKCLKGTSSL